MWQTSPRRIRRSSPLSPAGNGSGGCASSTSSSRWRTSAGRRSWRTHGLAKKTSPCTAWSTTSKTACFATSPSVDREEMPMGAEQVVVVRPGEGHYVGNVEFLARSAETPRFNLAIVTIQARRHGPPPHRHAAEDDAFYMLEGELVFTA